jgi:chorismate synthase
MLRYLTAGESHGKALTVIIDGLPAGLALEERAVNADLARRQLGFGRGDRMRNIERDTAEIISGVRWGETIGSPITLVIKNRDWDNHQQMMALAAAARNEEKYQTLPRPGHADLAGIMKFDRSDTRDVLERASARETAARVAVGAICRTLLHAFNIEVLSWVTSIGAAAIAKKFKHGKLTAAVIDASPVRCPDKKTEKKIIDLIMRMQKQGNTLGGTFVVCGRGVPPGLGCFTQWDRKLDGLLAQAIMSMQAIKGIEIGDGFAAAESPGSDVHDELFVSKAQGIHRATNHAGGLEGGMTNGEDIILRAAMKPISTLYNPLHSVDIRSFEAGKAAVVRSDVCAVPAAAVIGEAVVCFEIARAMKEKFGGDSVEEMRRNYIAYQKHIAKKYRWKI